MKEHTTNQEVEIERLNDNNDWNYRIVWGNPLTGKKEGQIFTNSLKINNFAVATNQMQIGEYQQNIIIQESNTLVNIVLDNTKNNRLD